MYSVYFTDLAYTHKGTFISHISWITLVDITSDCGTVETQICKILFEHHFRRIIQQIYSFEIMHSIWSLGYADTNTLVCRILSAFYQIEWSHRKDVCILTKTEFEIASESLSQAKFEICYNNGNNIFFYINSCMWGCILCIVKISTR